MPIALRLGVPRIVRTRGIPYPSGDPALDPEAERRWRRQLVETALRAVTTAVAEPTVFEADGAPAPAGAASAAGEG